MEPDPTLSVQPEATLPYGEPLVVTDADPVVPAMPLALDVPAVEAFERFLLLASLHW